MKKLVLFSLVLMMGVLAASAGTLGIAQFNDIAGIADSATLLMPAGAATFLTLKNNDSTTNTYTVLYFSLTGVSRTPVANTFTIAGNAARGWRPVQTDAAAEGFGSTIPNATSFTPDGPGTASILFTDTNAPSGRGLTTNGTVGTAFAWTLVQ